MTLREFDRLDPTERDYWVAEWQMGQQACAQHGGPRSECSDHDAVWYPQMDICHATMEVASARTRWELKHKDRPWHNGDFTSWTKEPDVDHTVHRDAGVHIWASLVDHGIGGDFLGAGPTAAGADKQPNRGNEADAS